MTVRVQSCTLGLGVMCHSLSHERHVPVATAPSLQLPSNPRIEMIDGLKQVDPMRWKSTLHKVTIV